MNLADETLRSFLDNKFLELKTVMAMQRLNTTVTGEFRINIKDRDAKS